VFASLDSAAHTNGDDGITNITYSIAASSAKADGGVELFTSIENLIGSVNNDVLIGDSDSGSVNNLYGGLGDDLLIDNGGTTMFNGGDGIDTVSYAGRVSSGVNITLTNSSGFASVYEVENLIGSKIADTLTGDSYNNVIDGRLGNDIITGNDGNDTIIANLGRDTAYGGNGNDTFMVDANGANLPTLIDGGATRLGNIGSTGGNVIVLEGLTSTPYSFTALAAVTNYVDTINVRDGVSTDFTLNYQGNVAGSQGIQTIADATGVNAQLYIKADSGDTLHLQGTGNTDFSIDVNGKGTANAVGEYVVTNQYTDAAIPTTHYTDYTVFNASNVQIAALHWQTA